MGLERKASCLLNAVRTYDFFGYDYWLPLWDNDALEICSNVPLKHRVNRVWFTRYVDRYLTLKMKGYDVPKKYTKDPVLLMKLFYLTMRLGIIKPLRFINFILKELFVKDYSIMKESYFVLNGIDFKLIFKYLIKGFEPVGIYNKFIYKLVTNSLKKNEIK